jgi:hypothetical protein
VFLNQVGKLHTFCLIFQPAIHTTQVLVVFAPVAVRSATLLTQIGVAVSTVSNLHVPSAVHTRLAVRHYI